jgi:hypothetical protein
MCTAEALKKLANREARQVCLLHGGQFTALVTFDTKTDELVFRLIDDQRPISVRMLLFQTEPAWVL